MKNIIHKLKYVTVALLVFGISSCDSIIDDDLTDYGATPVLVQFSNPQVTANFIQTPANDVYTYEVPVTLIGGKNQPIDKPVNVTVGVASSSTAKEGVEFNLLDHEVTIPAGEMTAMVNIEVLSENLDAFNAKTLVLEITDADLTISETSTAKIVLQAACELDVAGFFGTYDAVEGAASYKVDVSEGPEANTLMLTNLNAKGGETIIKLSEDPTNPTITYLSDKLGASLETHPSYGAVWATTVTPGASTYGSCDNALNLEYKRCVSIGCFAGTKVISLTKQGGATPM